MKKIFFTIFIACIYICLSSCVSRHSYNFSNYTINDTKIEKLTDCASLYYFAHEEEENFSQIYQFPSFINKYDPEDKFFKKFLLYILLNDIKINNIPISVSQNHIDKLLDKSTDNLIQQIYNIAHSNKTPDQRTIDLEYFLDNKILHCVKDYNMAFELNIDFDSVNLESDIIDMLKKIF